MDPAAAAYVSGLMSKPWEAAGLHCGELVRVVQLDLFGRELPWYDGSLAEDRRRLVEAFERHPARATWRRVEQPVDGAVVLMGRHEGAHARSTHAGVYPASMAR